MKTKNNNLFLLMLFIGIFSMTSQEYFGTTTFGDASIETVYDSAIDSNGNIYTVGLYSGTITVGSESITWAGGNADGYLTKYDNNGMPQWVKGFGGNFDEVATSVTIDAADNIYITGYFQGAGSGAIDCDPGPGVYQLMQQSPILSRDCFIIKLDSNGDFVWAKQVSNPTGGAANEDSSSIRVDSAGNIYIAGSFVFADFDPDPIATNTLLSADGGSSSDGFLLKLDTDGNFIWVKTFDGPGGFVKVESMDIAPNDDLLLSGRFENQVDVDPSAGINNFTSNGSYDIFLARLDQDGNHIWGQAFGGSGLDIPKKVLQLNSGIYLTGMFSGTVDLDPSGGVNLVTSNGDWDSFYSQFNLNGDFQYAYTLGGEGNVNTEEVNDITEGMNGNLYVMGSFIGTTDFDNGPGTSETTSNGNSDNFLLETTVAGEYVNHWTVGGVDEESNPQLHFNSNGEILTFGMFSSDNIDLDPLDGIDLFDSNGNSDIYFSRYITEPVLSVGNFTKTHIQFYPNPVADVIHIQSQSDLGFVKVYSSLGTKVISKEVNATFTSIDLSQLAAGIYIMEVSASNQISNFRIIKR